MEMEQVDPADYTAAMRYTLVVVAHAGAQRRSQGTYEAHELQRALGEGLLRDMEVVHDGARLQLLVPGPRLASVTGVRQTVLVPLRSLSMALAHELVAAIKGEAKLQPYHRRTLLAIQQGGESHIHAVRVGGVSAKTVRRLLQDVYGGVHIDARLGPRRPIPIEGVAHITVYVPPRRRGGLARRLAASLADGRLTIAPLDLAHWPPR